MGVIIMEILVHLTAIGFVFLIVISVRNKIDNSSEYEKYRKSDGLILMLVFYLLVFFAKININGFNIDLIYDFPDRSVINNVNWFPLAWIKEQMNILNFYEYMDKNNYGFSDRYTTAGLMIHFIRFTLQLLPLSFLVYVLSKKKWIGFIVAEVFGILLVRYRLPYLLGDAIVIVGVTYLIIFLIGKLVKKGMSAEKFVGSKKNIELIISYSVAGLIIGLGLVFAMDISMYRNFKTEKLVGTIELNEHYEFYNGLVTLNLTHASLYKNGVFDDSIKFNGNLGIDKSLYNYFGEDMYNEVSVTYKHSFYGVTNQSSTDVFDFSLIENEKDNDEELRYQRYLELANYMKHLKIDEELIEEKSGTTDKFFSFFGLSGIGFTLNERNIDSVYEILESGMGRDDYDYFEYTYKVDKLNGETINIYLRPYGFKKNGDAINFYEVEQELIQETEEYKILKGKAYIYNNEEIDSSQIVVKAFSAHIRNEIELDAEDILLEFDKEDFGK